MAAGVTDYAGLQERKKLLLEELNATQAKIGEVHGVEGAIDIHHPERSAGWPRYKHQEYPKMMYHPIKLDPKTEKERGGIRERNAKNPTYAPLDLPASKPLTVTVKNVDELAKAEKLGFVKTPPVIKADEDTQAFSDPLLNPELVEERLLASKKKKAK